jgi:hypothetical protein
MDDALLVSRGERVGDGARNSKGFIDRELNVARDAGAQRFTTDV